MPNIFPQNRILSKGYLSINDFNANQTLNVSSLPNPIPACSK